MALDVIIILSIFALSLGLIIYNFRVSVVVLLLLSLFLHKELFSIYKWDLMPVRVYMLALSVYFLVSVVRYILRTKSIKSLVTYLHLNNPMIGALVVLWFVRGLSLIYSKNLPASISLFAFFTTIVILAIVLFRHLSEKPEEILYFFKAYLFITFLICLFGFLQFFLYEKYQIIIGALWNVPNNLPRIGSTFWDVNHFGSLLAALIPVGGALFLISKNIKQRISYALLIAPMVILLILTNSRSSWIMAFVSFIAFIMILLVRKFGTRGIFILLFSLFIISIPIAHEYSIKSSPFRAKIKQYFHYRMDSFDSHFLLLTGALQIFEKYPILGGGYGSFFEQFSKTQIAPEYFGRDPAALNTRVPPHTIWGELVSETGILGIAVYTIFAVVNLLVLLFISLKSKEKSEVLISAAMFSAMIGWMIAGIFYSYNSEFYWILNFLYFIYGFSILKKYGNVGNVLTHFFKQDLFYYSIIGFLAAILIFIGLGTNHLIPWDEAIYAKVAKNMVTTGNYISQTWQNGVSWYEKPPLYMWMMSLFMNFLGFNSWAARIPSALFGLATVILVSAFAKKLFGRFTGFLSGFILLTTFQFLYYSRTSMLDVTTTFFITLSLFLYWFAKKNNSRILWVFAGVSVGLGVMTKDVIGLLPFCIIGLYEIYLFITKKQKVSKKLIFDYLSIILVSLAVFLPWHLEMYREYGALFIDKYIKYHVLDRALSDIEDKGRPFLWYVTVMKVSMRLWFIPFIPATGLILYLSSAKRKLFSTKNNWLKKVNETYLTENVPSNVFLFLVVWLIFVFLFFSVSKSKLVWYITPIYPVTSIITAYFITKSFNFAQTFIKPLNTFSLKLFSTYLLVCVGLLYLFVNKELVYTSDLTGSESRLLIAKDNMFEKDDKLYVDKVELPLILFYTDQPYEQIEFGPLTEKIKKQSYAEYIIFLTKESRFDKLSQIYPNIVLKQQDKDWSLGYSPSRYELDRNQLQSVQKEISDIENLIIKSVRENESLPRATYEKLTALQKTQAELLSRMNTVVPTK